MPIYEYECAKCGRTSEAMQKFSDPPLTVCEVCGGDLTKLVSRTSFQLKGSGWYATDYKKSSAPAAEKKEEKKDPPATTETKTATGSGAGEKK